MLRNESRFCGVDRGLVAMVQADRNLRAQPVGRGTVYHVRQPTRDGGEQNVIDGRRIGACRADRLEPRQRRRRRTPVRGRW